MVKNWIYLHKRKDDSGCRYTFYVHSTYLYSFMGSLSMEVDCRAMDISYMNTY